MSFIVTRKEYYIIYSIDKKTKEILDVHGIFDSHEIVERALENIKKIQFTYDKGEYEFQYRGFSLNVIMSGCYGLKYY